MVPEAKDAVALFLEPIIPGSVPLGMTIKAMLGAVDFDHDLCGVTVKIRHIGSHGNLAADMKSLKTMRLESMPELALCRCHRAAHALGRGSLTHT
ncbi:MAG: hypothetical protein K0S42_1809, partial [Microvirga sp.]|nr:hypothetical protein [Microvirga sp.]